MKNKFYFLAIAGVLLAAIAIWAEIAYAQRTAQAAQTWDYKVVYVETLRNMVSREVTAVNWYEDGSMIPTPSNKMVRLREFGAQGWEMFQVERIDTDHMYYWYKRAK